MVKRIELYRECTAKLEANGIPDSSFDAMCIFEDMLGERNPMFRPQELIAPEAESRIRNCIDRRIQGEPLQYILGQWEFWGYPFRVGEGVLIPRPDTETLIAEVLGYCRKNGLKSPKIVDLCSGSGCIAVTLKKELPDADISAVELSEQALGYLRENAELNNADISIIQADVLLEETARRFSELDIIVTNPPYLTADEMNDLQPEVRREPETALFGGDDGLDYYRVLAPLWKSSLGKGGMFFCEFGCGQHDAVGEILRKYNYININFAKDAGGIIRMASAETEE